MIAQAALAFLAGLILGSFLNVCIYRIPRGESVWRPARSYCPACRHTVRGYDNIPVVSYLLLRGRCRDCGEVISPRYPAVELLNALACAGCVLAWGWSATAALNAAFASLLIALAFIDYDHQILPDVLTLPGALAGVVLSDMQHPDFYGDAWTRAACSLIGLAPEGPALSMVGSLLGALTGSLLLFLVGRSYFLVRKRQGLGMGDVKMMAMVGAFLGWRMCLLTIFAGSFMGSLAGIFLIFARGRSMQHRLAFGTFLSLGAAFALFSGQPLLRWYLSLLFR